MQVGRSTQLHDELLARFRQVALLLFGVVVIAAAIGGRTLTRAALRPLRELAATIRSILQGGTSAARVPVRRIEDEIDEHRCLTGSTGSSPGCEPSLDHVAHDLRTPVTRLRATAATALSAPTSIDEGREALADCVEESDRQTTTLDALMDLAEAESGTMRLRIEPVDLADVVRDARRLYGDVAEQKAVQVTTSSPEQVHLAGDRNRVAQAIANLLDNAVNIRPPAGT